MFSILCAKLRFCKDLHMQIDPEDLEEFERIYFAETGKRLSPQEASEAAGRLAHLYALLARPLPREAEKDRFALKSKGDTKPSDTRSIDSGLASLAGSRADCPDRANAGRQIRRWFSAPPRVK